MLLDEVNGFLGQVIQTLFHDQVGRALAVAKKSRKLLCRLINQR